MEIVMGFANDPSMVRRRTRFLWLIEHRLRGCYAGDLALLIKLAISEKWIEDGMPSYGYELAWIFDRDRGTIRHALVDLERKGEIERVRFDGTRILFRPSINEERC